MVMAGRRARVVTGALAVYAHQPIDRVIGAASASSSPAVVMIGRVGIVPITTMRGVPTMALAVVEAPDTEHAVSTSGGQLVTADVKTHARDVLWVGLLLGRQRQEGELRQSVGSTKVP